MTTGPPDILANNLRVVFCGLNPGLRTAAAGHHFVGQSNRFWRVIHLAGFTPIQIEPQHDVSVLSFGIGLTVVVDRATAAATEISDEEYVTGGIELRRKIERYRPRNVAFLGKAAFSALAKTRNLAWGCQPDLIAGAVVWVLPNPSGRNLSFGLDDLVEEYGRLRRKLE
jgi:TDG/mug DNA glycosylase family protein